MSVLIARQLDAFTPFSQAEIQATGGSQGVRFTAASRTGSKADTLFSGGSWGIGPFTIHWTFKSDNEIDIDGSVFGIKVAELSGTLTTTDAKISGEAGVDFAKVRASIEAVWAGADAGLFVEGELIALGLDKKFKHKIASW